jgi:hypothetical protein
MLKLEDFDKWVMENSSTLLSPSDLINLKGGEETARRSRTRTRTKCCMCCGCMTDVEDAAWDDPASDSWL